MIRKPSNKQQGTVMIIAVIIMAVITGLAFNFTSQFQITLSQLNNRLTLSRIQQCLFTIESGAMFFLREDKRDDIEDGFDKGRDHLDEEFWSNQDNLVNVQLAAQGECLADDIKLDLMDSGRRFNLNWLAPEDNQNPNAAFATRYSERQKQFIRLLQTRKNSEDSALVSQTEAEQITDAVIDWIDENSNPWANGGAETPYYQSLDKPYRAANQTFTGVSELLLVKGFEERKELYQEIKPLLIALPADTYTTLNVNTMPEQLVRIINTSTNPDPLPASDAANLIQGRPEARVSATESNPEDDSPASQQEQGGSSPFNNIDDFTTSADFTAIFSDGDNAPYTDNLGTGSDGFILMAEITINDILRRHFSFIERENNNGAYTARIVRRTSEDVF